MSFIYQGFIQVFDSLGLFLTELCQISLLFLILNRCYNTEDKKLMNLSLIIIDNI